MNTDTYYQFGTGRLLARNTTYSSGLPRSDTTEYDRAGNILFSTQPLSASQPTWEDRASYYGADGRLYATDYRGENSDYSGNRDAFDEYRYDALGRRVWVRARRLCGVSVTYSSECLQSYVRRTVWAGSQELYEIQVPDSANNNSSTREYDTQTLPLIPKGGPSGTYDPNPYYGIVAYTYGLVLDKPLSITRLNLQNYQGASWAPFSIVPLWTTRGYADTSFFAATGPSNCVGSQ